MNKWIENGVYTTIAIIISINIYKSWKKEEIAGLKKEITEQRETIKAAFLKLNKQDSLIQEQNYIIEQHYNHVKRMQIIVGADTIDGVMTYRDKILNPINTKKALQF